MTKRTSLVALIVLLVSVVTLPSKVMAWEDMGVGAEIYRNEWATQLCANTFVAFPPAVAINDPFSPTFASQYLQARDAQANAYWMWLREGGLSPVWQWSTACYFNPGTPGGDWFNDGDEVNNNWYETQTVMNDISLYCATGSIGCTGIDWAWWGWSEIVSADIAISNTFTWNIVNQDTLRECLIPGSSVENTWLHELGHAYGIAHNDAVHATMNRQAAPTNCNMTQNYNDQPWPDDMAAMQYKYGTITGRHNLAASAWFGSAISPTITGSYKTGIGSNFDGLPLSVTNPTWIGSVSYTIEKYWDGTTPSAVFTRFVLVPIGTLPIFNWTSHTWSYPAGSSTRWMLDPASGALPEGNTQRTMALTFRLSDVGVGTYRLFVEVDPSHLITETDEGDNVIPLNVVIRRI